MFIDSVFFYFHAVFTCPGQGFITPVQENFKSRQKIKADYYD